MTRKNFLTRTLAGILAAIGLSKIAKAEEDKHMFNVQKLQERILELKANPPIALIPDEIKDSGSGACLYFNKMPNYGFIMNEICDSEYQYFYICERIVQNDGSGWISVKPYQSFTYLQGKVFPLTRVAFSEGTV